MKDWFHSLQIFHNTFPFLTDDELAIFQERMTGKSLGSKEVLTKRGKLPTELFFITKGMLRGFYIDEQGAERTLFLRPERTFFAAPEVMSPGKKSRYTVETIGNCELLQMRFADLESLSNEHHGICKVYLTGLKEHLQTMIFRVEMLAGMTPEERYDAVMHRSPQLFQSAHLKYIANYMGITPNSLSRIIKRKKQERT